MEERMEKKFLREIRCALCYNREGKPAMAALVLSLTKGSLEKTLKMVGACSK